MQMTQTFIEFISIPAFVCDGEGILLVNEAFSRLVGRQVDLYTACQSLFKPAHKKRLKEAVTAVIEGSDEIVLEDLELARSAYISHIRAIIKADLMLNERRALVILNSSEFSLALGQSHKTKENLINQEKLAGIGSLAAGVAHEIFNPLGYIKSNIDMLTEYFNDLLKVLEGYRKAINEECDKQTIEMLEKLGEKHELDFILNDIAGLFEDVDEGVQRVLGIVSGLKRFAHESDEIIEYDMNEGIKSTLTLSKNEFKYDAKLEVSYGEIPTTYAYGSKINQVILGMIVNAVYAIKKKYEGRLGNLSIKTFEEDGHVCCSICDDGVGISEEDKKKIFDPFYTTKPEGVGTGLGLSIARDIIVGQHQGKLEVESTVGEGACFTIRIPISTEIIETLSDREDFIQILRSQYK